MDAKKVVSLILDSHDYDSDSKEKVNEIANALESYVNAKIKQAFVEVLIAIEREEKRHATN